jgi:hypothetical protein
VELLPRCAVPLAALFTLLKGECDGISLADATALAVCDNRRISRHKVFKGLAARGKTSMGWFYGFKLHVIINSKGELIRLKLTPGNVDDRKPMSELCHGLLVSCRRQGLFGQRDNRNPGQARCPTHHAAQEKQEARAPHRL